MSGSDTPFTRRMAIGSGLALAGTGVLSACLPPDQSPLGRLQSRLRIIEANIGGTLGAELFDTGSGISIGLNENRRFGHCSSFKLSLAAKVLSAHANGEIDGEKLLRWTKDDLMFVSPFTTKRLDEGATMLELAEFTQKYSDNAAANILLRELGGPAALTGFWRSIGDDVSRLDRIEPALNNVPIAEVRDTTTPAAMARTVAKLIYGDALPETQRAMLKQWMIDTSTGERRVRAGLEEGWTGGDKTGTSIWPGMGSLYVDIGFAEPPAKAGEQRAPVTFAAYFRARGTHDGMDPASEAVLAQVGKVVTDFVLGDYRFSKINPF
ncbi:MAG: class A beta-lactamase [Pseudomonadota bacterium]